MNNKIRVLLVDDEEQFVLNMARLLRFRGFDVSTAFDGFKALEAIQDEEDFDVVVLDVKMPVMDGIATLSEIKKQAPDTQVIMLTGHATVDSGIQAIRRGAFDYLMKPCDIEDLTEIIREACEVERIKRRPVLWARNLVKEITWPSFIKLKTEDPLVKALEVFKREKGMPAKQELYVLDKDDRFQGVVTKRDLFHAAQTAHPELSLTWNDLIKKPDLLPEKALVEVMRPDHPVTTNSDENLTEVAHRMIMNNVRCIPVADGDRVIGIVRLQDIFKYMEHETE